MRCFLVSHTHWDREWYRTFQEFRARLVDAVDLVVTRLQENPRDCFLLDGQSIVLEDYLEIRPERRSLLAKLVGEGRLAVGPWYVQPDTVLPSGEALIRNLEEGRRVAEAFGAASRVAYTPDSFGHPSQLPQILAGFGLSWFVFWRGLGNELDYLPAEFLWRAPDGSVVAAHHLRAGYFSAAALPSDPEVAAQWLLPVVDRLAAASPSGTVLLMNGIDHARPQRHVLEVASRLEERLGAPVEVATLDRFVAALPQPTQTHSGELLGARAANLLPGVWSARLYLKQRNRRCEMLLQHWAEPWAALAMAWTSLDERPALRTAWRALLQNHAHDSICGCSQDRVHDHMLARFDAVEELARETARRVLERLAGLDAGRETPWREEWQLVVFNPSPHTRSDVVRFPIDPEPWFGFLDDAQRSFAVHPLLAATLSPGSFTVDGEPAAVVAEAAASRARLLLDQPPCALEFFVRDVPAFGCVRVALRKSAPAAREEEDSGNAIDNGVLQAKASEDGTFGLAWGNRTFQGLGEVEDCGDRGDTYDFDPVPGRCSVETVRTQRFRHPNGIQRLVIERTLRVPRALNPERTARSTETVAVPLRLELRLLPGLPRLDLRVEWDNRALDHRLRLLFPTHKPTREFLAATTLDVARRRIERVDDSRWVHPAPRTFPHQGWVHANGLTVVAPGLPEAEVTEEGTIAITLLRSVGWLSLPGLSSRPEIAGPIVATPGAQCPGPGQAALHVLIEDTPNPQAALDAELGLWCVVGGPQRQLPERTALLEVEPPTVVVSALRPWSDRCLLLRLSNPLEEAARVEVRFGFPVEQVSAARLDGSPIARPFTFHPPVLRFELQPHSLTTFLLFLPATGC